MGRIFTFGCSFTQYCWPTWADIILKGNEGYNLGICGGGHDMILYRLMEANRKFRFTKDDKIIVIFTTPLRWDLIYDVNKKLEWSMHGNITSSLLSPYLNKLFCIDGLVHHSFYNMLIIDNYLKKEGLNYLLGSLDDIFQKNNGHILYKKDTIELIDYVKNSINLDLTSFHNYLENGKYWMPSKKWDDNVDHHPRTIQHFEWVKNVLLKKLDIKLNVTEEEILEIENVITTHTNQALFEKDAIKQFPEYYKNRIPREVFIKIP